MTEAALTGRSQLSFAAGTALNASARPWFLVAALGQWIFVAYVAGYYGPLLVQGGVEALQKTHLPNGFVPGDTVGNAAIAAHLLLAVIIIGGGPLQLIPQIRARFPTFHRWLGRTYMLTAVSTSLAGLHMIWTRTAGRRRHGLATWRVPRPPLQQLLCWPDGDPPGRRGHGSSRDGRRGSSHHN